MPKYLHHLTGKVDEREIRDAWVNYPGRITNDNVHKDFVAGWDAGRNREAIHCPHADEVERLRRKNLELRRQLGAMSE